MGRFISSDAHGWRLLRFATIIGSGVIVMRLLVEVMEAYLHCAKAINRSKLWDASQHIDRNELPSYGAMLVDHCEGLTQEESDRQGAEMARRGMY